MHFSVLSLEGGFRKVDSIGRGYSVTEPPPPLPSPNSPSDCEIVTGSFDVAFDMMLLDPPLVSPNNYAKDWGTTNTEDAVAFSSVDNVRLKDCIIAALALVWGVLTMRPTQLEACYCLLHPHHPKALVVVH